MKRIGEYQIKRSEIQKNADCGREIGEILEKDREKVDIIESKKDITLLR